MDIRELLIDGIEQLNTALDETLTGLTDEQANWLPPGQSVSIGFHAWHTFRTEDNIANFVLQERKPPVWIAQDYAGRLGLPKVEQGTGMSLEEAQGLKFTVADLRAYGGSVRASVAAYLESVPLEALETPQAIRPFGELPRWKVLRQVVMTHGFTHLGEISALKGQLGLGASL